jgi:hypothetical protein
MKLPLCFCERAIHVSRRPSQNSNLVSLFSSVPALTAKPQPMSANDSPTQNFDESGSQRETFSRTAHSCQFTSKIERAWGFLCATESGDVGLWIRFTIAESPEFQKIKDSKQEVKMPIVDAIRMYPKNILLAMGARFAENGFFYIYATFVLAYASFGLFRNGNAQERRGLKAAATSIIAAPFRGA